MFLIAFLGVLCTSNIHNLMKLSLFVLETYLTLQFCVMYVSQMHACPFHFTDFSKKYKTSPQMEAHLLVFVHSFQI